MFCAVGGGKEAGVAGGEARWRHKGVRSGEEGCTPKAACVEGDTGFSGTVGIWPLSKSWTAGAQSLPFSAVALTGPKYPSL